MEIEREAEAAVEAAATELCDALVAQAPGDVIGQLLSRHEALFDGWAEACGFDLNRSSFEQRAERDGAQAVAPRRQMPKVC